MCFIKPYTLPCCRRVYVEVHRTPSCPKGRYGWPKVKCPEDLTLRSAREPKDIECRDVGECWRCTCAKKGIVGEDRNKYRPKIDSAPVIASSIPTTVAIRKQRMEASGRCWFCRGHRGCGCANEPRNHGAVGYCWHCGQREGCQKCDARSIYETEVDEEIKLEVIEEDEVEQNSKRGTKRKAKETKGKTPKKVCKEPRSRRNQPRNVRNLSPSLSPSPLPLQASASRHRRNYSTQSALIQPGPSSVYASGSMQQNPHSHVGMQMGSQFSAGNPQASYSSQNDFKMNDGNHGMSYATTSPQFMSHDDGLPRMSNQGTPDAQMYFHQNASPQQVIDPELLNDIGFLSHNGDGFDRVNDYASNYPSPP